MLAALIGACAMALLGTPLYLRLIARRALDIPNQRSSHTRPTPRGGGLVIVLGFLLGLLLWIGQGNPLSPRALGWLAGALLVAAVGFVDDLRSLPALPRLAVQLIGAVLLALSGVQPRELPLLLALPLAFVFVVVLTNIYNFMDGIDGLATSQAIVAGLAFLIAGQLIGNPLLTVSGGLLAAASLGFLVYNRPPARVFMGDVGSTFLGFSFAGLCLLGNLGVGGGRLSLDFGPVVLAPFLFDSLVTLARRMLRGERWYAAHRTHYYQRLVGQGLSHAQVTGLYAGLAIIAAAAALAGLGVGSSVRPWLDGLAYLPLLLVVVLVWRLEEGARRPEQPNDAPSVVRQGHT